MLDWYERLPLQIKLGFALAGTLMGAFSGRLPAGLQDIGLWVGVAVATLAIIGLVLHGIKERRGGARVAPWDLIVLGLGGMFIFSGVALVGVIWQRVQPAEAHEAAPTQNPEPKKYTAYDLETRIKATDGLIAILDGSVLPLVPDAQLIVTNLDDLIDVNHAVPSLLDFKTRAEPIIRDWGERVNSYLSTYSDAPTTIRASWNPFEISGGAEMLRRELVRIEAAKPNDVKEYMLHNQFRSQWQTTINTFYDWATERRRLLLAQRHIYENATVYGK